MGFGELLPPDGNGDRGPSRGGFWVLDQLGTSKAGGCPAVDAVGFLYPGAHGWGRRRFCRRRGDWGAAILRGVWFWTMGGGSDRWAGGPGNDLVCSEAGEVWAVLCWTDANY